MGFTVVGAPRKEIYGPFEVLERLGIGGMATVHRAIERGIEGFERVVALKRLLPHLAEDEEFVRAFVREAKLASLLRHLSIVQIYELGRVGSSYFISMEYIPGRDLRVILRHARRVCGPPPIEVALALMNELLDALDYAHGQRGPDGTPLGLVHRDISPSNLIVSHTGHLKIIDFGIAKATTGHLMTNTGRVKGKLSYMAPEALAGRLDSRSDLFSASVIAHELLTATPLFAAKEDLQTVERLQNMQPAPPSTRNPACPIGLDEIVLRGLAKDPAQRWQSASDMRAAIGELANDRHRLASKREVVHWVEEAFEMQPPARLRLPLTAPGAPLDARRGAAAASDADDELMDMVWGGTGPSAQIPVVLDEVPDVTGRIARAALTSSGRRPATDPQDPLVEEEPTNDMLRPGELEALSAAAGRPAGFRSTGPLAAQSSPGDLFSLNNGVQPHISWSPGDRTGSRPPDWAFGTSSTTGQPPPSGVIDPSIAAAQRAMAPYPGTASTMGHDKRSGRLLPLLIASVAVAGAGAAIAWIVSTGGGEDEGRVASASPPAVQVPPPEVSKLVEGTAPEASKPPPAPVEPSAAENKVIVADPDRADEPSDAEAAKAVKLENAAKNEAKNEKEERAARDEEDRESRKRARAKREPADERIKGRARARTSAEDEAEEADPAVDEEAEPEETGRVVGGPPPARTPTPAPRSSADSTTGSRATRSTESAAEETTTPAAPSTDSSAAAPPRARKPLVITPGRAKRESGTIPPLRFPPWEQAPAALTAKLCIDPTGAVTSVTVLSAVSPGVRASVKRALTRWRYRPVVDAGEKVAACFATTFQVKVE